MLRGISHGLRKFWSDLTSGDLLILGLSIVLAVTAISSVSFLGDRLKSSIKQQASVVLGADLSFRSASELGTQYLERAEGQALKTAETVSFLSMAIANEDTLEMLGDKAQVSKLVKKVGISLPQTWTVSAVEEIQPLIDACTLPLIVKPSVRTDAWWTTIREKAFRIDTRAELENALQKCVGLAPSIIVQEWIEGDDSNMFFYHSYIGRDRQCLAELVGQKLRQWPRRTGVGASSVQVDVPKLNQISRKLLDSTDFHGFCEIEYKRREGTDDYYFIEANVGRPSLHAALAESCGIEMQHTMYCDCTDMPLPEANEVKYSRAKSVVWRFELQAVARAWLDKELTLYGWIKSLAGRSRSLDLHLDDPAVVWAGFLQPAFEFSFKKIMSVIRGVSSSSGKTR